CSYVPKCERDNQKNKEKVLEWLDFWTYNMSSQSFTCFFNQQRRSHGSVQECFGPLERYPIPSIHVAAPPGPARRTIIYLPDDVLWKRSLSENVLLHCVLWPLVSLLLGTLIVLLTVCARSLAVRAEALQKRKFS
ncbi:hypothetical protein Z043_123677, partial [Scleropages formosus]